MVLEACREVGIPVAITIAGGYGVDIRETVAIHVGDRAGRARVRVGLTWQR